MKKNLLIITQKVDENDQLLGFFIDWLIGFSKRFNKIIIICLEKGEFNLPDNIKVLSLGKERGASKIKQLLNFYRLVFNLSKEYDAVFVHMNPIWVVLGGFFWRQFFRKKIIFWYTHKAITLKLRLAELFADVILTASKESFRLPSKKVNIVGHGIDTNLFRPDSGKKKGDIKILSIGRIAPIKNYEILIEAAKILAAQKLKFSITVIGEPAVEKDRKYEAKIKDKIKNLGLESYFDFLGKINYKDLIQYYQSHNLFIHSSKTGSVDKALLEAMASGMNVLSSNDAATVFLPRDLIFAEDSPQELAEKIKKIYRKNFGQELRNYVVENHNLEKLLDKIVLII